MQYCHSVSNSVNLSYFCLLRYLHILKMLLVMPCMCFNLPNIENLQTVQKLILFTGQHGRRSITSNTGKCEPSCVTFDGWHFSSEQQLHWSVSYSTVQKKNVVFFLLFDEELCRKVALARFPILHHMFNIMIQLLQITVNSISWLDKP